MYIVDTEEGPSGLGLAEPSPHIDDLLGRGPTLRRFGTNELFLSPDEARRVLEFFWPGKVPATLTDQDRAFAQALLIEAVDASCKVGFVKKIFDTFYMKIPGSTRKVLRKAAKLAVQFGWLRRCGRDVDLDKVGIYRSVRNTLARNFRSAWEIRRQGGDLIY